MIKKLFLGAVAGGIILFIWSAVSWMALPWHRMTLKHFRNEPEVSQFIISHAGRGVFYMPTEPAKMAEGPFVFANIDPQGGRPMGQAMVLSFLIQALGAFFVTFLVCEGNVASYWDRVGCVLVFAIAAGAVCYLPHWNWWRSPTIYTVVNMLDLAVGWFFAGLAIAKVAGPNPSV